jgi:hypothetical protein
MTQDSASSLSPNSASGYSTVSRDLPELKLTNFSQSIAPSGSQNSPMNSFANRLMPFGLGRERRGFYAVSVAALGRMPQIGKNYRNVTSADCRIRLLIKFAALC